MRVKFHSVNIHNNCPIFRLETRLKNVEFNLLILNLTTLLFYQDTQIIIMFIQQENSPTSKLTCAVLLSFLSGSSHCVTVVLTGLVCKTLCGASVVDCEW